MGPVLPHHLTVNESLPSLWSFPLMLWDSRRPQYPWQTPHKCSPTGRPHGELCTSEASVPVPGQDGETHLTALCLLWVSKGKGVGLLLTSCKAFFPQGADILRHYG